MVEFYVDLEVLKGTNIKSTIFNYLIYIYFTCHEDKKYVWFTHGHGMEVM